MPPAEFEPTFPACGRQQNHTLDRRATETARIFEIKLKDNESVIALKKFLGKNTK